MILEIGLVVLALGVVWRLNSLTAPISTMNTVIAIGLLITAYGLFTEVL